MRYERSGTSILHIGMRGFICEGILESRL